MNEVEKIRDAALNILFPKRDKLTPPVNRVWVAIVFATAIFGFLDLLTMVSVGYATRWFYGVLVFFSGIVTLIGWEFLYANPYSKGWQKPISVIGFFASVVSTVIIGLLAIVVTLVNFNISKDYLGAGMVGFSFVVLFFHAVLFILYFFLDETIQTRQNATAGMAEHQVRMSQFELTKSLVAKVKDLEGELSGIVSRGDESRFKQAHNALTGKDVDLPNR